MAAQSIARNTVAVENAARDEIVLEHLSLVKAIAIRVHENLPVHVDLDDLVHAGVLGLFDAADKIQSGQKGRIPKLCQAPHQGRHSGQPAPARLGLARSAQAAEATGSDHARSDGANWGARRPNWKLPKTWVCRSTAGAAWPWS